MKLFTRLVLSVLAAWIPLVAAFATTYTVSVGNNFYSPQVVNATVGDVINFVWQAGNHPTMSDSSPALWATFPMDQANQTKSVTLSTVGNFQYHCTAHSSYISSSNSWVGQTGTINVTAAVPTAATSAQNATPVLSIFPNPSHGQVTLQLNQKAGQDYKLRLSNIIGKEIRLVALKPELTASGLAINLGDLPAGIYFYSLLVNDKVVSTKRLTLQN